MKVDVNSLGRKLNSIFTDTPDKVLFHSRPVLNQYINLDIVKYFLKNKNNKDEKGVMINLHRSHLFMAKLLKNRKIRSYGLIFMDGLFSISGDSRKKIDEAIVLPCPFSKDFEETVFTSLDKISPTFIIIDDIVALQNYWGRDRIRTFLDSLVKKAAMYGDPYLVMVADSSKDEWLLEVACSICENVVEVDGFRTRRAKRKLKNG